MFTEIKLQTKRLILRKFCLNDASFVYTLMNSPGWLQFIGDRGITSIDAATNYIQERFLATGSQKSCGFWCVVNKETHIPMGIISMVLRDSLDEVDLGFAFSPEFLGQGFAFEASQAFLQAEKRDSGLSSVLAFTDLQNQASQALLEKLGFTKIGLRIIKEEWGESLLYRLKY